MTSSLCLLSAEVEGFKMDHFDEVIERAVVTCDENVEPHPLWEYPAMALAKPVKVSSEN